MKSIVYLLLLIIANLPVLAWADLCTDGNNQTFQQVSQYCQETTCETSGSACKNVYIGTNPAMPGGLFFTSDFAVCGEGDDWTGYWTDYRPCSAEEGMSIIRKEFNSAIRPKLQCGSIVRVEDQTLGESIPLTGVTFDLIYSTKFVNGRVSNFKSSIKLAGDVIEPDISSFDILVEREGLSNLSYSFTNNTANKTLAISWDGKNAVGQEIQGYKKFKVTVTEHRVNFDVPVVSEEHLGGFRAHFLGLGGWAPSIIKFYDIYGKRLIQMSGEIILTKAMPYASGQIYVASEDSSQVYIFDSNTGRHLYTKTGLTGTEIYRFIYDSSGRLTSVEEPFNRITNFNRNVLGELTSITSPYGQITSVTLDQNGYLASMANPNNETYVMTYSGTEGLLSSFQKPGGQLNTFSYDNDGHIVLDTHSGGYFFDLIKSVSPSYNVDISSSSAMGRLTKIQANGTASSIDRTLTRASGLVEQYLFNFVDGGANEYSASPNTSVSVGYVDDPRFPGMGLYPSSVTKSASGMSRSYQNSLSVTLSNTNDPFSISTWTATSQLSGANANVTTNYDPIAKKFTSATYLGRTQELNIDSHERVISLKRGSLNAITFNYTNENLTSLSQGTRNTTLGYNATSGFLESITNPLNQTTSFVYNNAGRVTSKILPDSRVIGFGYDANGNITSITPPGRPAHVFSINAHEIVGSYEPPALSGVSVVNTAYQYNLDKQLTQITRPEGSTIDFNYNSTTGVLESFVTPDGTYNQTMDTTNGLPSVIYKPDGSWTSISYAGLSMIGSTNYDSSSSLIGSYMPTFSSVALVESDTVSNSLGTTSTINYLYNDDEDLTKAGDLTLSYNTPNGQLTGTSIGTGTSAITDTYTYNNYGEVTDYVAKRGTTTIYSLTLARDASGRINGKTQTMNATTDAFEYTFDDTGRLTETKKNTATVATYGYDSNSNRNGGTIGAQPTTASYDDQDRLTTYNTLSFTYNANGDLTSKTNNTLGQTTQYTYDVFGNLKQVQLPGGPVIDYEVDALNRRIGKKVNGVLQKRWVYMDQYRIAAELNAAGAITKRFVYGSKSNIPDYMIVGSTKYRIISDHLGSPRLVVKMSDGSIAQRMDHDEFGRVTVNTNPDTTPFGFAGGLYDHQTSLVRFGARDYDSEVGRWTAKDPILFKGGDSNLFGYVANDAVNWIDPTGLYQICSRPLDMPGGATLQSRDPIVSHQYIKFEDGSTASYGTKGNPFGGAGIKIEESGEGAACGKNIQVGSGIEERMKNYAKTKYSLPYNLINNNCQQFVGDVILNGTGL